MPWAEFHAILSCMKTNSTVKLIDNYPFAFRNNPDWTYDNLPCKSGWLTVMERLFDSIEQYLKSQPKKSKIVKNIKFGQIKEKFGELVIYMDAADDEIYKRVEEAENQAKHICELCGRQGMMSRSGCCHWKTLCNDCCVIHNYEPATHSKIVLKKEK